MINALWTILDSIRIQDFFDIAIISIMIYGLLIWFKETASRFVLVGIGLLGAVYILSRFFQLYLTAVVLQGFFAILLVTLVVIFQEELRRFFERLAMWGKIRKRPYTSSYHRDVEVISQAVTNLAQKHIGALVVIRGEEPLDRHIDGGMPLEGLLSQALLESIFDPHSAGHDGAVVIHRGRVVQFGCHLPLSLNPKKFRHLGLRHTAALGLAERSDALCIVLSEERGDISVALEERLTTLANARELKEYLDAYYAKRSPREKPRRVSERMRKNFREKAAAVLLASILWLVFGYQRESIRRDFVVPVEYRNLATEWVIEEPKITEAKVMLMGPEQAFRLLDPKALKISLDLAEIREGRQKIPLTRDMVKVPSNLSLERIKPGSIRITAYRLLPVEVPVKISIKGALPSRLTLQKIVVTPPSVTVLASPKLQKSGIRIRTEPIALEQVTETTTLAPKLLFPTEIRFFDGKPPSVKVTIEVRAKST
ncbi:MAG: DNA integrity scanning protein DisA nucleotide-binding domain protein [Desulfobacterales bacterium]|nr:DNA integrity scanning protein DisA nucleotide-binding domain protein [Desulfobacterales bacterium]